MIEAWNNDGGEEYAISEEDVESTEKGEDSREGLPSPEAKERSLTFEQLSKLSTEEYIELWRHLNPFYVTHVTRQGVRDHAGMMYHTAGVGGLHDGCKKIFASRKMLCSPAEASFGLPPDFTEEDVVGVLDRLVFSDDALKGRSPRYILSVLPFNFTFASADPWADSQAIHFAQHTVLDDLYGGERGNEVFFVFPTDVVASQCKFGGQISKDLSSARVSRGREWNDLFVWPEGGRIPLDAGFVFLPKSQMVDRKTGSKYATREVVDEFGNVVLIPEKDEERIERFKNWLKGLSKESPEIVAISNNDYSLIEEKLREIGIPEGCIDGMVRYSKHYRLLVCVEKGHFGNLGDLSEEQRAQMSEEEIMDYSIRMYLAGHNADLKLSEDTVPAEEYWEQYFSENPEQRPAHIVYYDGDPSTEVREFLIRNGIAREEPVFYGYERRGDKLTGPGDTVERDGKMLGFDAHYIGDGEKDEHLVTEHRRFNEIVLKILKERFGKSSGDGDGDFGGDFYEEDLYGF